MHKFYSKIFKGGGGGGFRLIILENNILRYEFKGKARTRPEIFRVVLGQCAQCCLGAKMGQKIKIYTSLV